MASFHREAAFQLGEWDWSALIVGGAHLQILEVTKQYIVHNLSVPGEITRVGVLPRVSFCGYSIPHPSASRVNIRVQTTGDPAKHVFKDSLQDLAFICQHVRTTFDKAVADFKVSQPLEKMNIDKN